MIPIPIPSLTAIKAGLAAALLLGTAIGSTVLTHKVDNGRYQALQASVAEANAKATQLAVDAQKAADAISRQAAQADAVQQRALATRAQAELKEVQNHVKVDPGHCVTWGLVRVLDAAAQGIRTANLPAARGKSDAACAPIDAVALARSVVANYYAALANAGQLNALIANLRAIHSSYP